MGIHYVVIQIGQKVVMEPSLIESSETTNTNKETEQTYLLSFPNRVEQGDRALRNINRERYCHLAENKKAQIITKLGSKFNIKGITKKDHQQRLIYRVRCNKSYNDELERMLAERVNDHSSRDKSFHMCKLSIKKDYPNVKLQDFEILRTGSRRKKFRRKISEVLFIKENKPSLNRQQISVLLSLLNCCKLSKPLKCIIIFKQFIELPWKNNYHLVFQQFLATFNTPC